VTAASDSVTSQFARSLCVRATPDTCTCIPILTCTPGCPGSTSGPAVAVTSTVVEGVQLVPVGSCGGCCAMLGPAPATNSAKKAKTALRFMASLPSFDDCCSDNSSVAHSGADVVELTPLVSAKRRPQQVEHPGVIIFLGSGSQLKAEAFAGMRIE